MKPALFLILLLAAASAGFSQSVTPDQIKAGCNRTWKSGYVLMNGMRIDAKAGIPQIVFDFKNDNTLQTFSPADPGSRSTGSWKYLADKKQIQVRVSGAEKGLVTAINNEEMSMILNTSQMGGAEGSEMILVLTPMN